MKLALVFATVVASATAGHHHHHHAHKTHHKSHHATLKAPHPAMKLFRHMLPRSHGDMCDVESLNEQFKPIVTSDNYAQCGKDIHGDDPLAEQSLPDEQTLLSLCLSEACGAVYDEIMKVDIPQCAVQDGGMEYSIHDMVGFLGEVCSVVQAAYSKGMHDALEDDGSQVDTGSGNWEDESGDESQTNGSDEGNWDDNGDAADQNDDMDSADQTDNGDATDENDTADQTDDVADQDAGDDAYKLRHHKH